MKNTCLYFAFISIIQLLSITIVNAQATDVNPGVLKPLPAQITVNGDLKDWSDTLLYFNAENGIRYQLSNDKENLYFAIRIDDPYEMVRVLSSGITLSLDPKGKKKDAYTVTFPVNTQVSNPASAIKAENILDGISQADRDELLRETVTTLRGIKVEGFKDIEGDMITTSNSYGIKTAINYDDKGSLVCEGSISFKLLHTDDHAKNEWLYGIKINGITHAIPNKAVENSMGAGGRGGMGGGGRGGMGGGGGRGGRGGGGGRQAAGNLPADGSQATKTIDFSGKFSLANL